MHNFFNILKAIFLGLATGFVVALPLGPAGIESVKRTMSNNLKEGVIVSLGAVTADMTYLLIINCGLSSILSKNKTTESFFWIISGLILCFIGYKSLNNNKSVPTDTQNKYDLLFSKLSSAPFLAGFAITFTNPMTPSLWITLSGTVIKAWQFNTLYYYTFILSILVGMISWFLLLNYLAFKGMKILTPSTSNKTSMVLMLIISAIGVVFVIFGLIKLII